jgi:hypothetical protein
MTRQEIISLAERCEAAIRPDRMLDRDIAEATLFDFIDGWIDPPDFTSSLDAAMTLVPEGDKRGVMWLLNEAMGQLRIVQAEAPRMTPNQEREALARFVTAACLRAIANGAEHG